MAVLAVYIYLRNVTSFIVSSPIHPRSKLVLTDYIFRAYIGHTCTCTCILMLMAQEITRSRFSKLFNWSLVYVCRMLTVNVVCFQAWPPGIECQICHMTFSDQSAIIAHYGTKHGQPTRRRRSERGTGSQKCDICGMKFAAKSQLRFHQANAHGIDDTPPSFKCDLCSRQFNHKTVLKRHLAAVHRQGDVTVFNCEICDKAFGRKDSCERHMAVVHGVIGDFKTFVCDVCGKVCSRKLQLNAHMASMHGTQ